MLAINFGQNKYNMKQPELGKKISELRKVKGMTQEELVEKCNISVRTIQRIETGEVTPRMYTIKTILSALDYDLNLIADDEGETKKPVTGWLQNFLLIEADSQNLHDPLIRQLNIAGIAGIIYFALGFLEAAAEYVRFTDDEMLLGSAAYIFVKVCVLVSVIFFLRGLIVLGGVFDNYLLRIMSVVLIGAETLFILYDVASLFYNSMEHEFAIIGGSLTFGCVGIVFGIALRRLDRSLGRAAEFAGILEIMSACFFISVFLSFMGLIVQIPATLFEIILIFKAIEVLKTKQTASSLA